MSSEAKMESTVKLSKRLKEIEALVSADYGHIWDCCCDHGFLGRALLERQAAKTIHFVDIVPKLISDIEARLQASSVDSDSAWQVHCIDVADLPLEQVEGKNLVIIAGVGGDLISHFVEGLHRQHPDLDIDFILCPVHHQFKVREKLIQLDFSLKKEILVKENKRFYEVIFVSSQADPKQKISPVGESIWQPKDKKQADVTKEYLDKTLKHYSRMQQGNGRDVSRILEAYQKLELK